MGGRPDLDYLSRRVSKGLLEGGRDGGKIPSRSYAMAACDQPQRWSVRARVECVGRVSGMNMRTRIGTKLGRGIWISDFQAAQRRRWWTMIDDR